MARRSGSPDPRTAPDLPNAVNKFTVCDRLAQLPPLHRRAALQQAQEEAGGTGPLPTLSELLKAETPPAAECVTRVLWEPRPTRDTVAAETARVLADPVWRAALPLMPASDLRRAARGEAEARCTALAQIPPRIVTDITNRTEYEKGQALAVTHGPIIAALDTILTGLDTHITGVGLAAADEDQIRGHADRQAAQARAAFRWRTDMCARAGRPPPILSPHDRRRQDPAWQRRRLRRTAGLARQHLAAALGTVGRGGDSYADDYSLARRRERDDAARAWADSHEWTPPGEGNPVSMADIRQRSDAARLARLGAMTRGMDELAERQKLIPIMLTLTLPPEWHPAPAVGRRTWTVERGPQDTDDELRRRWMIFRARASKSGVALLGLRVWEPHRDGCPHAHALLYVRPDQVATIDAILQAVCPEPVPGQRVASKLVVIDRTKSKGSSYVMKYLRKTLAPRPTGADAEPGTGDDDHLHGDHHDRTRATASERGWRRYATLGTHGVQRVWQCLATASESAMTDAPPRAVLTHAHIAAGRWADALEVMGAVRRPGAHRLRLGYETETDTTGETTDPETGEVVPPGTTVRLLDRYGSPTRRAAWLTDSETPTWRMPLGRGGSITPVARAAAHASTPVISNKVSEVTVSDMFPREGAQPPPKEREKAAAEDDGPHPRPLAAPRGPAGWVCPSPRDSHAA